MRQLVPASFSSAFNNSSINDEEDEKESYLFTYDYGGNYNNPNNNNTTNNTDVTIEVTPIIYLEDHNSSDMLSNKPNQANYFYNHHIILLPHGAGTTNTAFSQRGNVIIEVFPYHMPYIFYFRNLVQQVGATYLYWYENDWNVINNNNNHSTTSSNTTTNNRINSVWEDEYEKYSKDFMSLKQGNITPPVTDIYELLVQGIESVLRYNNNNNNINIKMD